MRLRPHFSIAYCHCLLILLPCQESKNKFIENFSQEVLGKFSEIHVDFPRILHLNIIQTVFGTHFNWMKIMVTLKLQSRCCVDNHWVARAWVFVVFPDGYRRLLEMLSWTSNLFIIIKYQRKLIFSNNSCYSFLQYRISDINSQWTRVSAFQFPKMSAENVIT